MFDTLNDTREKFIILGNFAIDEIISRGRQFSGGTPLRNTNVSESTFSRSVNAAVYTVDMKVYLDRKTGHMQTKTSQQPMLRSRTYTEGLRGLDTDFTWTISFITRLI
jgi:hypothetical protein